MHVFFTAHCGLVFHYIIYEVFQCDLPSLRPHWGRPLGRRSNPGTAVYRSRDTNPKTATPEWEVVPLLIAAHLEEDLLEDVDGAGGAEEVERLAGEEGKEDTREEASHQALYSGYPLVCGLAYKKI